MPERLDIERFFPARLYDALPSGNGYKVRLTLAHLKLPYTYVEVDIFHGASRTPEFLALNPNGKIPVLELGDGTALWESNSILWWLTEGTEWLPDDRLLRQRALQWMFFEQYSHEPYIAVRRARLQHPELGAPSEKELATWLERGHQALDVMERALSTQPFLAHDRLSVADIALYAYTHVAHEGGFELARFPAVQLWLERVREQLPDLPLDRRPG